MPETLQKYLDPKIPQTLGVRALRRFNRESGLTFIEGAEHSSWLRARLTAVDAGVRSGAVPRCQHLRHHLRGIVALWAPMRLVCGPCTLTFPHPEHAAWTCDCCATGPGDKTYGHITMLGQVAVCYRVCRRCHNLELGR